MNIRRILLPTDFSENSMNAAAYALHLLKGEKCGYYLLNAFEVPHAGSEMLVSMEELLKKESVEGLNNQLKQLQPKAGKESFFKKLSVQGEVTDAIEQAITAEDIDLVIMGTRGASGLREPIIGSNTASVVQNTYKPVLAVPEKAGYQKPGKIVFAADMKSFANIYSLEPLREIALKYRAEICILHIVNGEENLVVEALEGYKLDQFFEDVKHSYHFIEKENIEKGINEFIDRSNADMLAMLPRKTRFFDRLFHKSTTRKMIYDARLPLLAIHDVET